MCSLDTEGKEEKRREGANKMERVGKAYQQESHLTALGWGFMTSYIVFYSLNDNTLVDAKLS
jgi:hypothetical protein